MPGAVFKHPIWKQAVDDFLKAGFKEGDVIPKDWFYTAFGLTKPSNGTRAIEYEQTQFQFMSNLDNLKRELLEDHMIDLRNARRVGYRWVPAKEQTRTAFRDGMKAINKELHTASRRIENTDVAKLTADERRQRDEAQVRLARLASMRHSVRRLPGK